MMPAWRKLPSGICRVDAIRPFVLHAFGGFYLDLDIRYAQSLDVVLHAMRNAGATAVLCESDQIAVASNFFMGALAPRHPFFGRLIYRLHRNAERMLWRFQTSLITTMCMSGPMAVHAEYARRPDGVLLLPASRFAKQETADSIGVHAHDNSWRPSRAIAADAARIGGGAALFAFVLAGLRASLRP